MLSTRQFFVPVIILVILAFVLACAAPVTSPTATSTAPFSGPTYGGTLRIAIPLAPIAMDTVKAGTNNGSLGVYKTYNETLYKWSGRNNFDEKTAPWLATSYEISPDGYVWTFKLRQGVKWQNIPPVNGREFTADDVVYHWTRILDPKTRSPIRPTVSAVTNVEAVDKYTVKFTCKEKIPGFLAYIIGPNAGVVPREVVEAEGGQERNWVGTGAFILKEYQEKVKAVFVKNPDYWDKGKPYLDSVEIYFIPDAAQRTAAFRAGQVDVLALETKTIADQITKTTANTQITDACGILGSGIRFGVGQNPQLWGNKKLRQSFQYMIDYDGLIQAVLDGGGIRTGFLAPYMKEWGAKQVSELPKKNPAKAKQLLAEAGYANGLKTTILLDAANMNRWGGAVEPIVAMIKEFGIDATIQSMEAEAYTATARAGDFELATGVMLVERPLDPDNTLQQMWQTGSTFNYRTFENKKYDELIAAERAAFPDKTKRIPIIKDMLSMLEEEVPGVPLFISMQYVIQQPRVKGWVNCADPQNNFATHELPVVWLSK